MERKKLFLPLQIHDCLLLFSLVIGVSPLPFHFVARGIQADNPDNPIVLLTVFCVIILDILRINLYTLIQRTFFTGLDNDTFIELILSFF